MSSMGTGIDGGLSGISVSMPAFLIKFGAFNPETKSLYLPSLWKGLWDSMVALGVASEYYLQWRDTGSDSHAS
jgi:hypothetical protein